MNVGDTVHGYEIIEKIQGHGSERQFFRCRREQVTSILVYDEDIEQYLALQRHLFARSIAVPEVHWSSAKEKLMVIEDLGPVSLYSLCENAGLPEDIYRQAIDELVRFQIDARPGAPVEWRYDREHMRWEQEYFRDHFLIRHCGLTADDCAGIEKDLAALIESVAGCAGPIDDFLMHRDFQSQNIFIKNEKVRIIDFQSARIGPLTYDITALLRDAYCVIDEATEQSLLKYYIARLGERGIAVDGREFRRCYELTGLQRNMQALGAFANLSYNKNKPHFLRFIPRGLELLRQGLERSPFAALRATVSAVKA